MFEPTRFFNSPNVDPVLYFGTATQIERRSSLVDIVIAEYKKFEEEIRAVRETVFVIEQNISRELEFDDRDKHCTHAIVFEDSLPIAVGRIDLAQEGKIGRLAVLKEHRKRGVGRMIMLALEEFAKEKGQQKLCLHAQKAALAFYVGLGYQVVSDEFLEAEIIHITMEKEILA